MARFLSTTGLNHYLEELIKRAKTRLVLVSPYLRLNDRIKELLHDCEVDVRLVYGKTEMAKEEMEWLRQRPRLKTTFCKNLHAKCYLNESACLVTSLNLYDFSQINNNEMGVLLTLREDETAYLAAAQEVDRIVRVSVAPTQQAPAREKEKEKEKDEAPASAEEAEETGMVTTSKLAQRRGMKTKELLDSMQNAGLLEDRGGRLYLTDLGKREGGQFRMSRNGPYFLWPLEVEIKESFWITLKRKLI